MNEVQDYPKTFEEFVSNYAIVDKDEVYTNGVDLVPLFRVLDGWEHYSKNLVDRSIDVLAACLIDLYCNLFVMYNKIPEDKKTIGDSLKLQEMHNMIASLGFESQVSSQLEVYRRKNI